MYLCIELVCPATTYFIAVIWINRVRLPNLLVVSSTGRLSVLADASVVSKSTYLYVLVQYCCLYFFIYQVYFKFGDIYVRARFTAVCACMCNYSGMYVKLCLYV